MSITKNKIKDLKSLQTKKGRHESGCFPAEGVRLLEEALRFKYFPEILYYAPAILSERGHQLIKQFASKGVKTEEISTANINQIAATQESQGLLAVFKTPDKTKLPGTNHRKQLWCENISDPGNLGTLMRSAAAFGFNSIILSGQVVEPHSPKVVRSSVGAVFAVDISIADKKEILDMIDKNGSKLIATDLRGENNIKNLSNYDNKAKLVLAIGSEAEGLSRDIISRADMRIKIEHSNHVESLNAAIAGSILMSRFYQADKD